MAAKKTLVAPGGKEYDCSNMAPADQKELQAAGWKKKPQPKPPAQPRTASNQ